MSVDQSAQVLFTALLLVLPIAALVARRLPMFNMLKMALIWLCLFGAAFAAVSLWQAHRAAAVRGPDDGDPADAPLRKDVAALHNVYYRTGFDAERGNA